MLPRPSSPARLAALAALAVVALILTSACRRFTKEGADREVYGILASRRAAVPELQGTLDIEAKRRLAAALRDRQAFKLTLRDALELGTVGSRDYRQQRENVYIAALDLTRQLNAFRPLWGATGSTEVTGDAAGSDIGADIGLTLEQAFESGGGIVLGLASTFLRNISGDPLRVAQTILSADLDVPLMRGSGRLVAREALTQAERNLTYALRDYARFQQEFTVDVASTFYRALQSRDSWQNAEARYTSLKLLVDEQRENAIAGRLPKFEVDQVEQDLLESDDGRQRAHNAFVRAVDRFKLDLGIPVTTDVELDDSDLEALRVAGSQEAAQAEEAALGIAAQRRLDLRTQRDREADARRQVCVARDALRPGLNLRGGASLTTPDERPLDLGAGDAAGNLGLDLDLPLERTAERNAYRRALIEAERAMRERERAEDNVVLEVRDAYRTLAESLRSYVIQQQSLKLAERRVDSTQELLADGRAKIRDRLEAETALVRARNAVTAALVDHALARLGLERDVGTLRVDAKGMWEAAVASDVGNPAPPPGVPPVSPPADLPPR